VQCRVPCASICESRITGPFLLGQSDWILLCWIWFALPKEICPEIHICNVLVLRCSLLVECIGCARKSLLQQRCRCGCSKHTAHITLFFYRGNKQQQLQPTVLLAQPPMRACTMHVCLFGFVHLHFYENPNISITIPSSLELIIDFFEQQ
jgi:hypothetical protein